MVCTMNMYDFLETSAGQGLMSLPMPLLDSVAGAAASMGLFSPARFVKQLIASTGVASDEKAVKRIEKNLRRANARYLIDLGVLMHAREAAVHSRFANVRCEGLDIWRDVKRDGVIFFSAHFACFYIGLFAPEVFQDTLIIRRFHSPGRNRLLERVSRFSGKGVEMVGLTDKHVGLRLLGRLRRGGAVAAMMDYFYEDTSLVVTDFMGAPAATPAGLAMMAVRIQCPVVPVFILRDGDGYLVKFEEPLVPSDSALSREEATFMLVSSMNAAIERTARHYPEQWTFWPSLPRRWDYAKRIRNYIDQETAS